MEPTLDKHIQAVDKDGTFIHRRKPVAAEPPRQRIEPAYKDATQSPAPVKKDDHVPHKDLDTAKHDVIVGARFMGRRLAKMVHPPVNSNADEVVKRSEVSAEDIPQAKKLAKSEIVKTMAHDLLTAESLAHKLLTSEKPARVFLSL